MLQLSSEVSLIAGDFNVMSSKDSQKLKFKSTQTLIDQGWIDVWDKMRTKNKCPNSARSTLIDDNQLHLFSYQPRVDLTWLRDIQKRDNKFLVNKRVRVISTEIKSGDLFAGWNEFPSDHA